jgi:hypothetical protein
MYVCNTHVCVCVRVCVCSQTLGVCQVRVWGLGFKLSALLYDIYIYDICHMRCTAIMYYVLLLIFFL